MPDELWLTHACVRQIDSYEIGQYLSYVWILSSIKNKIDKIYVCTFSSSEYHQLLSNLSLSITQFSA